MNLKKQLSVLASAPFAVIFLIFFPVLAVFLRSRNNRKEKKPRVIFGTTPIINNKYWSKALRMAGYSSFCFMETHYRINQRTDFEKYFDDLLPLTGWARLFTIPIRPFVNFIYAAANADIIITTFNGFVLQRTILKNLEAELLHVLGKKVVIIPYGADAYRYSAVRSLALQNALLVSYPQKAREEREISHNVFYWSRRADVVLSGVMPDGLPRWDMVQPSFLHIDTEEWTPRPPEDIQNRPLRILHSPNHRGFKGTEFLVQAVEELKKEGYELELVLLENVPNTEVRKIMQSCDILVEQLIGGYAMSAIEGLASGLVVISNVINSEYHSLFNWYSFSSENPIIGANPESVKDILRVITQNSRLRKELILAGVEYAKKYHSLEAATFMFEKIFEKIWSGGKVDLMNLYHPLNPSSYNNMSPKIEHPLKNNQIPKEYFQ